MQRLKKDPALAELPAPVLLTPDQLVAVAAGAAATLPALIGHIIIAGAVPVEPVYGQSTKIAL